MLRKHVEQIEQRVRKLEYADVDVRIDKRIVALQKAYDALFDFLADELGFEGRTYFNGYDFSSKVSPREFKTILPGPAKVKRTKKGK